MKILESQLKVILESINKIIHYTDWYSFEDFLKDEKTFDACLMQLQHLWETTNKLVNNFWEVDFLPTTEMIWLRNFIAHEYLWISEKLIFETIQFDLPWLKVKIDKYLIKEIKK